MHLWQQQQQQEKQLELVALLSFPYLSWHLLKLHWNWEDNADCSLSVSFFSENEHLHVSAVVVVALVVVAFSPTLFVYFSVCFSCDYVVWRTCRPSECSYAAITSSMLTHRQTHSHTHTYVYKRGGEREGARHWYALANTCQMHTKAVATTTTTKPASNAAAACVSFPYCSRVCECVCAASSSL